MMWFFINNKWRFRMKNTKKQKLELIKVEKGMSLEKIRENLRTLLTNQGIEIKKKQFRRRSENNEMRLASRNSQSLR